MAKKDMEQRGDFFPELSKTEEEFLRTEGRQRCLTDLHYLSKHVLGYSKVTDHIHKDMSVDIDTPRYKFKLLLWPRGHYKSTIGTESYPIQKLLRDPTERILITNAKLDNSRRFLKTISNQFENNLLFRWLWREQWIRKHSTDKMIQDQREKLDWVQRDTQDELVLLRPSGIREPSISTGAVNASLVSQHYSTIIGDDLVNRDYVSTIDMVENSILYFKDLLDLLDPDGEMLLIGTRWAHMDLYGWIIEEFGGIASLRVPDGYVQESIVAESKKLDEDYKRWMISIRPVFKPDGTPIFPEEFTPDVLHELESAKGPYEFGAQYKLDPTPTENQKFQEDWFIQMEEDDMPNTNSLDICITIDPAKSIEDHADNTAIAVCGYNDLNHMFLLDGVDERLSTDEFMDVLFNLIRKWQVRGRFLLPVGFEAVGFQETYVYNIERRMLEEDVFFSIEPIKRRTASKNERILRLVPRIKNGFFVPRRLVIEPHTSRSQPYDLVQRLKWQLLKFPFAGKDDLADALADQMDIVQSHRLPGDKAPSRDEGRKPDFVHQSIIDDRRRWFRRSEGTDGAVR
jgi:hypothetical protein